jgi:oligopeptidase B
VKNILAPRVKQKPFCYKIHNQEINDNFNWLRDKNWPNVQDKEVLAYLKKENKYCKSFFLPLEDSIDIIFNELKGRIKLSDKSIPLKYRSYFYFNKTTSRSNYVIHLRSKRENGKSEIILDENKMAKGKQYFRLGAISVSPDESLIAYSQDIEGDERYTIHIKNLNTGNILSDLITNTLGNIVWQENGQGFYYTKVDEQWRSNKLFYHKLGTSSAEDKLIYHEQDTTFRVGVSKSSDYRYIFVDVSSSTSDEIWYMDSSDKEHKLNLLIKRKNDHLCSIDHIGDAFFIQTNDKGKNFRLVRLADKNLESKNLEEIISHNPDVYLTDFCLYDQCFIVETREGGLDKIYIYQYNNLKTREEISFPDPTYTASVIDSEKEDDGVYIHYSSMVSPSTCFKRNFKTGEMKTLKVQEIPSGYDSSHYKSERLWALSRDGKTKVPVSIVYKKSLMKKDGSNPLYLYGYGSYGMAVSPGFNTSVLSLLDRGFIFAIAHIRGGDDLGFEWYEAAKFLNKKKTFEDFVDIAKYLIGLKYTSEKNILIVGRSAGGLLVGNVVNSNPELFKAVIADVPFVDVLNTMLDESLPLTPGEFKEWGNPKEKEYFDYMKSYSPYDNIKKQDYPDMYVQAGLNDPRVTYWEPAKWVAKLREMKTDNNTLLLETNMSVGHGGNSKRFERIKEVAKEYAFILKTFNLI